ncbi:hypothetical protein RJ640_030326 [Escallonia rubra]|uniref:GT-1/4-like C-terminal domain-containing protein n=1 Tax=Escallonia rubra TaxID=112253 RepID=A0AA88QXS1_9ASTE|nr:hypothetical protein RJ640_030326 [Escallonia rubra]
MSPDENHQKAVLMRHTPVTFISTLSWSTYTVAYAAAPLKEQYLPDPDILNLRSAFNLEQRLDHDGDPLGVSEAGAVVTNGLPAWNWRGTPRNGGENESRYSGRLRVISVTWGDCTKRIGIDGSSEAIKEAIKSAFGLRTNRAFWLEDEDEIVRALDREMPLSNYRLHLDEGLTIKVCLSDVSNHRPCRFIEKTFYRDDDLCTFLRSFGWIGVRGLRCNKHIDSLDDLVMDEVYHGVRLVTN